MLNRTPTEISHSNLDGMRCWCVTVWCDFSVLLSGSNNRLRWWLVDRFTVLITKGLAGWANPFATDSTPGLCLCDLDSRSVSLLQKIACKSGPERTNSKCLNTTPILANRICWQIPTLRSGSSMEIRRDQLRILWSSGCLTSAIAVSDEYWNSWERIMSIWVSIDLNFGNSSEEGRINPKDPSVSGN